MPQPALLSLADGNKEVAVRDGDSSLLTHTLCLFQVAPNIVGPERAKTDLEKPDILVGPSDGMADSSRIE